MNHEACRELLVDLAYGELSRRKAAEVERHLAECETCKVERDHLDATVGAMRRLEAPPGRERGEAVLVAAARKAAEERRRDSFRLALSGFGIRIAAGSAFAMVAAFLLVSVRHGLRPPTEDVVRAPGPASSAEPAPVAAAPQLAPAEAAPSLRAGGESPSAQPGATPRGEPPRRELPRATAAKKSAAPDRTASLSAPPAADLDRQGGDEEARGPRGPQTAKAAPPRGSGGARAPADAAARSETDPDEVKSSARGAAEAPSLVAPALESSASRADTGAPARRSRPGPLLASPGGAGSFAREIERRHAAGELSDAQKRFDPCPGGDVRRTAWIDREQRVRKLLRERADGILVEEWFDDAGRLREALVRGRSASGPWARHLTIGEHGEETVQDASGNGLAPEVPPPALVRRDPAGAFFSGPGCGSAKRP
jgi:hypothetical protein